MQPEIDFVLARQEEAGILIRLLEEGKLPLRVTHRPGHNLDHARTQFKLVSSMEAMWEEMHAIVRKYCR